MTRTTRCMPCWLAERPPAADNPHGCPGYVIVGDGPEVTTKLCSCLVCWPDGLPPAPEPPLSIGRTQVEG